MKFETWIKEYETNHKKQLKEYWEKNPQVNQLVPGNFGKELLQQYMAYKKEIYSKRLVWATWGLAIATIILSTLTLYLQYTK